MPIVAFIIIGAVCITIATEVARRRRLAPLLARPCAGREWRRSFAAVPKSEIREFLKLFVEAFGLRGKHCLAFRPNDRIMDVYRAMYPPKWTAVDDMELEYFALLLKERYTLDLTSNWRDDLTLGEIFSRTVPIIPPG
jgi:propanediol dehydratase small subunit